MSDSEKPLCLRAAAPLLHERDPEDCPGARMGACCEADPDCAARTRSFELLTRSPDDVVLLLGPAGRIVDASARAAELYGRPLAELRGLHLRELRVPGSERAVELELELARTQGEGVLRLETLHRRGDGVPFPVEVSARALRLRAGTYVLSVVRDAVARTSAEQAAALGVRRFQAAFRVAGLATVLVGGDGRILEDTPVACELLGRESLVGHSILDLTHPGSRPGIADRLRAHREGMPVRSVVERRLVRGDGALLDVIVHTAPVRDATGRLLYFLAVLVDVTERRRLEEQLVHSERLASVGTLAAGVAHEVNNPLAYVLSNLRYAIDETRGAGREVADALAEALEGARRVQTIVNDLRALARGEDASAETDDLAEVLRSAVSLAQGVAGHRARVAVEVPALPPVAGARTGLCQVFVNLLVNAAQALDRERPGQEIRVRAGAAAGGVVWVEVEDTGAGIPAELRARVFEPFFTTRPVGRGAGLGLFVAHGIVSRAGGRIELSPRAGGGTVARVELRAARAVALAG